MTFRPHAERGRAGLADILGSYDLAAPSSLISSRWSRDNLVTSHPEQLYGGNVLEHIDLESLERLLQELNGIKGSVQPGPRHRGVFTWDIACESDEGPFVVQVPRVLDERGGRGRTKRHVPHRNAENMRHFIAQGLTRFVVEPKDSLTLGGNVPAATFATLPGYHPVSFGLGAMQVELSEGKQSWVISLGPRATAELLAELIAALVYHYDPNLDGGTALTDVFVNDGDFWAKRRPDGGFEVRLTAARQREGRVGPALLLLYLVQLMAYEDWSLGDDLLGLPVLISNPSVAFAGVVRGLGYRYRDLGKAEQDGQREALRWIRNFARSREGRAYRPWVDRFLDGRLPPCFGEDPRERWWRLAPMRENLGVLELRSRHEPASAAAKSARVLRAFLDRLAREIGRLPEPAPEAVRINDVGRDDLLRLLEDAHVPLESREAVTDEVLAHWPYRNLEHLTAQVPGARGLRRLKSRISFGHVVLEADEGTPASLGPAPKEGDEVRALANPELFGVLSLPKALHATATRTFPTFQAYMDAALHDRKWGYYGHSVIIGRGGHFITNPESLSPHYGKWLAACAFKAWRDMVAHGELSEAEVFPIIEFGAGNGRLARDILDAVARNASDPQFPEHAAWQIFGARVAYRVYETSESLRDKQRQLLGEDGLVAEGDARHPEATLKRDFPGGVKGFILSNEVPDAFGVHKVVLTAEGLAWVALVVPRVERSLRDAFGEGFVARINASNTRVRQTFGFQGNPNDFYLEGSTYTSVMEALSDFPAEQRDALLSSALWFEEAYVPASAVPELGAHLRANATQYATALAAESSGVVLYINIHAARFIRELGASLSAGMIVTIDYGDTTWSLVQGARQAEFPFRVYGDSHGFDPRPNDPYSLPGTQDMTADVNFTELARAGEEAGLTVLHFGPERDLVGDELPEVLAAAADQETFHEFLGNAVFKVLVLGTRASDVFSGPLLSPLPLVCREQDVAKARRHEIPSILRTLITLER